MALVRAFSTLYDIVGRNAQDESSSGDTVAKEAIVQVVQETSRDNKLPWQLQGRVGGMQLPALIATNGPYSITPTQTDIEHIAQVFYIINGKITYLEQIESEEEWLRRTDNNSNGDPIYFRTFEIAETGIAETRQIIVWPGPSSAFITNASVLRMSYFAVLALPSADADIIRLPREHEPLLINGGTFYMALKQGDSVLMGIFGPMYEDSKRKLKAALTYNRFDQDITTSPAHPYGLSGATGGSFVDPAFSIDYGQRYG